ncbi:hypothetical protein [Serratia marcescens]|uniref:hypothetical protein n=1 Tax=Serratia marcescens TaxID=615 RepID=UPI000E5760E5|nr:hypothetical protein [Serratia marcescens]AXX20539.1 hypothetical protein C7M66_15635 [Serratia marcescens]AXX26633.1 hypothetical protein C7M65_22370 [Serratia marcescens]RTF01803.1 hypothetical protein C7M70_02690 [Serratia marcescens]RTF03039.1 hypothetical protein C7M68_00690 [Serratia marcescens]RTF05608.1 hypothetical protein C7M69_23670 [Serratia marcescens]
MQSSRQGYRYAFMAVNGFACLLHGDIFFTGGIDIAHIGSSLALLVLSMTPYLITLACFVSMRHNAGAMIGAWGALALDGKTYYDVFIAPLSSTAAIGLLITPTVNILFVSVCCVLSRHLTRLFRT